MKRIVLVMIVGALLLSLTAGVAFAVTKVCSDIPCLGTNDKDQLGERDGSVQDNIKAKGEDDIINARRFGNDEDRLFGQSGNDKINSQDGDTRDIVNCGKGNLDEAIIDAGELRAITVQTCETIMT